MQWLRSHMLPLKDYYLIVRVKFSTHKCSKCKRKKNDFSLFCSILMKVFYRIYCWNDPQQKSVQKSLFWPHKTDIDWNDFVAQDCNHWQRKLQTMSFTVDFASYKWTLYSDSHFLFAFFFLLSFSQRENFHRFDTIVTLNFCLKWKR